MTAVYRCPRCGCRHLQDIREGLGRHEGPTVVVKVPYGHQPPPPLPPTTFSVRLCLTCERDNERSLWRSSLR